MDNYIEAIEVYFADPNIKRACKGIISYFTFFGAKYIGQDISRSCDNFFDHNYTKIFTLLCIFYQSTDNFKLSLMLTILFYLFQNFMEYRKCEKDAATLFVVENQ